MDLRVSAKRVTRVFISTPAAWYSSAASARRTVEGGAVHLLAHEADEHVHVGDAGPRLPDPCGGAAATAKSDIQHVTPQKPPNTSPGGTGAKGWLCTAVPSAVSGTLVHTKKEDTLRHMRN